MRLLLLATMVVSLSATVEIEAIATGENEATQTDWVGDLGGRLGIDSAAGRGRSSAAAGRKAAGYRPVGGGVIASWQRVVEEALLRRRVLTFRDRAEIGAGVLAGLTVRQIAERLGRAPSVAPRVQ